MTPVIFFRRGLRGKARDFNWHNVIGFWCAPVLIVLTATGMVISYSWASNLVYTLTGSPRPVVAGRGGGPGGGGAEEGGGRGGRGGRGGGRGSAEARAENAPRPSAEAAPDAAPSRARHASIALRTRRASGADVAHDDHPPAATRRRSGRLLDVRPRILEQLRPLDADPRWTHRRRRALGAVHGDEPRAESPRLDALRPYRRARRPRWRSRRRRSHRSAAGSSSIPASPSPCAAWPRGASRRPRRRRCSPETPSRARVGRKHGRGGFVRAQSSDRARPATPLAA